MSAKEPPHRGEPFVMVPCRVIDELMPHLKDTELRLLLVVLRQTVGRRNPDGSYKERDWLSHSQLKARTGRAGEAVSAAVDALVKRGLIDVRDGRGIPLTEAKARRGCRGRLYYGLDPALRPSMRRPAKAAGNHAGIPKTTGDDSSPVSRSFRNAKTAALADAPHVRQLRIEMEKGRIRDRLAGLQAGAVHAGGEQGRRSWARPASGSSRSE